MVCPLGLVDARCARHVECKLEILCMASTQTLNPKPFPAAQEGSLPVRTSLSKSKSTSHVPNAGETEGKGAEP